MFIKLFLVRTRKTIKLFFLGVKELNKILGIDENNNYVYKYEIETNKQL